MIKPCVAAVLLLTSLAHAQPGATPPQPYQTYAAPQPPPQLQLTNEDVETLSIGYISDGQYIGGGLASLFVGFGAGQAVEGRWHDTGWIFTLGEPVAAGVLVYGLIQNLDCFDARSGCTRDGSTAIVVGMLALVGLRLWEVIDAFIGPPRHNERYRALQLRLGNPMPAYTYRPFVAPSSGGAVAGLTLSF